MDAISLESMLTSVGLTYGLAMPVIVLVVFILLTLPAVFRPSVRAEAICFAAYCCLAQMLGILLMSAGGLPALYAVFAQEPLSEIGYVGLLFLFAVGGVLFLWHDSRLQTIDAASAAIPAFIFFFTWKFIGLLITVFAGLSFMLQIIHTIPRDDNWWVTHLIMLLYGLVITWFALRRPTLSIAPLEQVPPPPSVPVVAKKPVARPISKAKPRA